MTLLKVRHVTTYRYRRPVAFGEHRLMFRPRDSYDQKLLRSTLETDPPSASVRWVHDLFGNCVALVGFDRRADHLHFETTIHLDHSPMALLAATLQDYAEEMPFTYSAEEMPDLLRSMERQYLDPAHVIDGWARQFLWTSRPTRTRELLATMTYFIHTNFRYLRRSEPGIQDPVRTLALASGTCRDFALLMMEAVRSLGLAARFVSGYLCNYDEAGEPHESGGATHAWLQVYLPGAGWVEFDPTNGIVGNRDLVRVAVVRDPRQAVPLSGTYYGAASDDLGMTVDVSVMIEPDPPQTILAPPAVLSDTAQSAAASGAAAPALPN